MHRDVSIWRPLVEFAFLLTILGIAGCLQARSRDAWWLSHGLMWLGLLVGFAAAEQLHPRSPVSSLVIWVPVALLIEGLMLWRGSSGIIKQSPQPTEEP